MKDKLRRFMMGRYGIDEFNRFLLGVAMVLVVLDLFIHGFLVYLGGLCLIYCYYRMLSKNISRRFKENQIYLNLQFKVKEGFKNKKLQFNQSRKFHIYKCPHCGQKIRIPRGKGKISIHCPKCGTDFMKHS